MKKLFILIIMSGVLMQCSTVRDPIGPDAPAPAKFNTLEKSVLTSGSSFGLKMFRESATTGSDSNVFISPLSISMALGMTLNGANGETYEQMQQTLELQGMSNTEINEAYRNISEILRDIDGSVLLEIANSIWPRLDFPVEQTFIDVNRQYFDADVRRLDFSVPQAVDIINAWVAEKTHGKIDKVLDGIPPAVVMYLINAVYFKADWRYAFDPELTTDEVFYLPNGEQLNCKLMRHKWQHPYLENDLFQAVDLVYGSGNFTMTVLLPKPGVTTEDLAIELNTVNWDSWLNQFAADSVNLYLPRFKVAYDVLLNDALINLGMPVAFGELADFTGISAPGGIYISRVIHKTFVEVNEVGTEAAAVTVVEMLELSAADDEPVIMRVDRPFIFLIREKNTGSILFMGKIVDPT